jgi:hypothetical protein
VARLTVIDIDTAERDGNRSLGLGQRRPYDFIYQRRAGWRRFNLICGRRRTQNVVSRNAIAFPSELVAAVRPSNSLQDTVPHQRLQHRLEMARWQPVTGCQ